MELGSLENIPHGECSCTTLEVRELKYSDTCHGWKLLCVCVCSPTVSNCRVLVCVFMSTDLCRLSPVQVLLTLDTDTEDASEEEEDAGLRQDSHLTPQGGSMVPGWVEV